MKHLIPLLAAGLTAASCVLNFGNVTFVGNCTEEGIDHTEVRDVGPFRSLQSSVPCNVYYVQADEQEVRVESTEEFASKVLTEVKDGSLYLKLEPGRYPKLILRVVVSSPDIESIQVSGSGNLVNEGGLHAGGDLNLKVSGSGDISTGEIVGKAVAVSCSGSGDLHLEKVACTGFSATVSGSGGISIPVLEADGNASARVSGSGRIHLGEVAVDGDMDLKTSGSGDIVVNGACHYVNATSTGSGSVSGNLSHTGITSHTSGSGSVSL